MYKICSFGFRGSRAFQSRIVSHVSIHSTQLVQQLDYNRVSLRNLSLTTEALSTSVINLRSEDADDKFIIKASDESPDEIRSKGKPRTSKPKPATSRPIRLSRPSNKKIKIETVQVHEGEYTGTMKNGMRHGTGKFTYPCKTKFYDGQWAFDKCHGYGRMWWTDGRACVGQWNRGAMNGRCTIVIPGKGFEVSEWKDGVRLSAESSVFAAKATATTSSSSLKVSQTTAVMSAKKKVNKKNVDKIEKIAQKKQGPKLKSDSAAPSLIAPVSPTHTAPAIDTAALLDNPIAVPDTIHTDADITPAAAPQSKKSIKKKKTAENRVKVKEVLSRLTVKTSKNSDNEIQTAKQSSTSGMPSLEKTKSSKVDNSTVSINDSYNSSYNDSDTNGSSSSSSNNNLSGNNIYSISNDGNESRNSINTNINATAPIKAAVALPVAAKAKSTKKKTSTKTSAASPQTKRINAAPSPLTTGHPTYLKQTPQNNPTFTGYYEQKYFNGSLYSGEWLNGARHGFGTYTYSSNGSTYVGSWKNGLKDGPGRAVYKDKTSYVGEWSRGKKHGPGLFVNAAGVSSQVEWVHGEPVTR
jgi:hypothetical protein